ncbi:TetR/AcrR family transcriptional regulator [Massilia sp. Leaf139]|uniref:TetR/AcrR family transcriptional regulator n=1 Tax=Massilia sp. Leaf139 TaxID=1736272 RepID=UPI0006FDF318|nr:TetR/AcrR family transcriptional regulator [Massilia sp. Leaf139]KQQ97043.1 TetR family transcriptional regulator [Massilia sp. Leaf139]
MNADTKSSRREQSHQRILEAAARAVRRQGYAGVGVAEVMKEAGLTHGGFYAHFKSRDALLAAAIEHAAADSTRSLSRTIRALQDAGASPVRALVEAYLADNHLATRERGCVVAALGSEMPRQTDELLDVSRARVAALVERARSALAPDAPLERAFLLASSLVGALQMARALGDEGRALLPATRAALINQYDTP